MELDREPDMMLPCSYGGTGEEFSARCSLFANEETDGKSMAQKLIQRRIETSDQLKSSRISENRDSFRNSPPWQ